MTDQEAEITQKIREMRRIGHRLDEIMGYCFERKDWESAVKIACKEADFLSESFKAEHIQNIMFVRDLAFTALKVTATAKEGITHNSDNDTMLLEECKLYGGLYTKTVRGEYKSVRLITSTIHVKKCGNIESAVSKFFFNHLEDINIQILHNSSI